MSLVANVSALYYRTVDAFAHIDGLPALLLRVYLAPIFITAGLHKINHIEDIISWFGNPDWGLGLPAPELMAYLAAYTEFLGGFALLLGLATRLVAIPLMVTMLVAALTAHWDNGWFAIASSGQETSIAYVLEMIGFPGAKESLENSLEVATRLGRAKEILEENGNYSWLSGKGSFVVLNNGIEFAATYFIMLLSLFFTGGGRYVSADHYLAKVFPKPQS
ncbi:DoxX family protein [uncultured Pseudoteredinibacter sp.]|uniref:HvfX family Cu-binding RiPP maturation protein n=1 Tax=uncultured Pseudoteredinibacter sp. TaxID=1641701 RepID=UPI0026173D3A|nr:DoxX family protein [uncultured Pseudoteredinibacter sp.]